MAALYEVLIGDASTDYTFALAGEVDWVDVERIHRRDLAPNTLCAVVREVTFRLEIPADTPASVVTALGSFLSARVNVKTLPTHFCVRDVATHTALSDLGDMREISQGGNWDDLEIVSFELLTIGPQQLVAGAWFQLVVRGRRLWTDTNGFSEFEQEYTIGADSDGLAVRRLVTHCKVTRGTDVSSKASLLRVARPAGWIRLGPSNNSDGIEIRYPRYPRTDEAIVTSAVKQLGDGYVLPALAGDGSVSIKEESDAQYGITRTTTTADITGSTDPLGNVKSEKPTGGIGTTTHDRARRRATGEWETRATDTSGDPEGKVTRWRVSFTLSGAGAPIEEQRFAGPFPPLLRRGARGTWRLTERVDAYALDLQMLSEVRFPAPLSGAWLHDHDQDEYALPTISEFGGVLSQHLWVATITRHYWWAGPAHPLLDSAQQNRLLDQLLEDAQTGYRSLAVPWA